MWQCLYTCMSLWRQATFYLFTTFFGLVKLSLFLPTFFLIFARISLHAILQNKNVGFFSLKIVIINISSFLILPQQKKKRTFFGCKYFFFSICATFRSDFVLHRFRGNKMFFLFLLLTSQTKYVQIILHFTC